MQFVSFLFKSELQTEITAVVENQEIPGQFLGCT